MFLSNEIIKNRIAKPLATLLISAFFSACTTQPVEKVSFPEKLSTLQEQHKFGAASRLLKSDQHPEVDKAEREKLIFQLKESIKIFERSTAKNASDMRNNGQWGNSIAIYEDALSAFPESLFLREKLQTLFSDRDEYTQRLQLAYLVDRAQVLNNEVATQHSISDAHRNNNELQKKLAGLYQERELTANELLKEGQRRLALGQYKNARRYLSLSQDLLADTRTETALRLAKRNIKPKRIKTKIIAKPKAPQQSPTDLAVVAYKQALENNELRNAFLEIRKATKLSPDSTDLREKKSVLQKQIGGLVDTAIEQGKYQYSLGNINAAIEHWQSAVTLAPFNDALKERLAKAKLFQRRYEELKD